MHGGGIAAVFDGPNRGNGMFGESSSVKISDIRDGKSMTFLLGERRMTESDYCGAVWMRSVNRAGNGGDGTSVAGVCDHLTMPNDARNPDAFSSPHKGGAHFVMVDASVRFVQNEIDPKVYERLARIEDERTVRQSR